MILKGTIASGVEIKQQPKGSNLKMYLIRDGCIEFCHAISCLEFLSKYFFSGLNFALVREEIIFPEYFNLHTLLTVLQTYV